MMEYCKQCLNYHEEYDEHRQAYNDVNEDNQRYCMMYKEGIPNEIINNESECSYFVPKEL